MANTKNRYLSNLLTNYIQGSRKGTINPKDLDILEHLRDRVMEFEDDATANEDRIKHLQEELDKSITAQQSQSSRYAQMAQELEIMRIDFEHQRRERLKDFTEEKAALDQERIAFELEKERYKVKSQEKLSEATAEFVKLTIAKLENSRSISILVAYLWAALGAVSLLTSFYFIFITYSSIQDIFFQFDLEKIVTGQPLLDWPSVIFFSVKGIALLSLFGILARYSFVMFKEYKNDTKLNTDRIHGIKFGQLYLNSYGANANWEQLKEAFSYWHEVPTEQDSNTEAFNSDASISSLTDLVKSLTKLAK